MRSRWRVYVTWTPALLIISVWRVPSFLVTLHFIYDVQPSLGTILALRVKHLPIHVPEVTGSNPGIASFFGFSPNRPVFWLGVAYPFLIIIMFFLAIITWFRDVFSLSSSFSARHHRFFTKICSAFFVSCCIFLGWFTIAYYNGVTGSWSTTLISYFSHRPFRPSQRRAVLYFRVAAILLEI